VSDEKHDKNKRHRSGAAALQDTLSCIRVRRVLVRLPLSLPRREQPVREPRPCTILREQILLFSRLDLHQKPPDSRERRYKSRTSKREFGPTLRPSLGQRSQPGNRGLAPSCPAQPWEGGLILFYNCLDSYHKVLDSGERQDKSRTMTSRSDPTMNAFGVSAEITAARRPPLPSALSQQMSSEYGTCKTVMARF